jgi:hypothetical protein
VHCARSVKVQPNVTSPTIPLLQFDTRTLGTNDDHLHHGRHTTKRPLADVHYKRYNLKAAIRTGATSAIFMSGLLPSKAYTPQPPPARPTMSASKTEIYTAHYDSSQFVVGGGVAIFHLATSRVVICSCVHRGRKFYFLPKGRRDAGEESGTGAEREGYEEVL